MTLKTIVGAAAGLLMLAGSTQAATFFAWDTSGEDLWSLDTSGPSGVRIGGGNQSIIAEIQWGGGVLYGADTSVNTNLHRIDPATGLISSTVTMSFPVEGDVITSMEYVGGTLYAGLTTEGGGPTYLSTIDAGTGVVTTIGATGFGSPFGGLTYDGTTMYAISAGGSPGELFTVDLTTGAATSVGLVEVNGRPVSTTALEFGTDGVLYAVPNQSSLLAGHLLSIDPSTGNGIDLGHAGIGGLVSITVPAPSTLALLGAFGLLGRRRRM